MNTQTIKTTEELVKGDVLVERVTVPGTGATIINYLQILVVGEVRAERRSFIVRARLRGGTFGREQPRYYTLTTEHMVECGIPTHI